MKKFILCGCSWAEGVEILPPGAVEQHRGEIHALTLNLLPEYVEYRKTRKYGALVAQHFQADLVDLSFGGNSNHSVVRTLLNYLSTEGYFSGRDTSDIFISVGWSNPQRVEMFDATRKYYERCNELYTAIQMMNHGIQDVVKGPTLGPLLIEYFEKSNHPEHYINEWARLNFMLYHVLKTYNVAFTLHQNFYELQPFGGQMHAWYDEKYWDVHYPFLNEASREMLNSMDEKHCLLRDASSTPLNVLGSVNDYLREYHKVHAVGQIPTHPNFINLPQPDVHHREIDAHQWMGFGYCHPNEQGHVVWARHMIQEIEKKFYSHPR
jgi:hypothetical protein